MSPVQRKSPPVQVKEPYGNFDMVRWLLAGFHPATRSVLSTSADNTRKRVWQYIEEEKKEKKGSTFTMRCNAAQSRSCLAHMLELTEVQQNFPQFETPWNNLSPSVASAQSIEEFRALLILVKNPAKRDFPSKFQNSHSMA